MGITPDTVERIKGERDRFVAFAFCWGDLLFEVDAAHDIVYAAGPTKACTGYEPAELKGRALRDMVVPADGPLLTQLLKTAQAKGRFDEAAVRIRAPAGKVIGMAIAGYCLDAASGKMFIALRLSSAAAAGTVRESESGLLQADSFAQVASARLKELQSAGESAEMTLVTIPGIDELRRRLDQRNGQRLTSEVAALLKAGSVGGDSVARVADGKFSLIHDAGTDVGGLVRHIEQLCRALDPKGIGVDVAAATVPAGEIDCISEEDLANGLLYAMNKFRDAQGGAITVKGMFQNIGSLVGSAAKEITDFRTIVHDGLFDVALQPILDLKTGEIHHFEALCRFDADGGASPYRYITFAEETGLIHDFDLAMVRKVIEKLGTFPRNTDRVRMAVNVSGRSVCTPSYVDGLHALLKQNLWTKGKLLFEITESSRMADLEGANRFIQGLRNWGYEVCLDDFGAGAASFQYLSTLEVDVVKLDGSAIRNARRATKGHAFLTALTELCRRLGVDTIAEMVDDADGLNFVRNCGCDYVQGYLFGKPSKDIAAFSSLPNGHLFRQKRWEGAPLR